VIEAAALGVALIMAAPIDRDPRPSRATVSRQVALAALPPPAWREFAACVADRESGGSPTAQNPTSSAAGKWQFLDAQWRSGLAYMVRARLIAHGVPWAEAKRIRLQLQATPIHRWPERLQDVGFTAVVTQPGGWRHWHLAGSRCNALVP
jgi:hypothetical protein